MNHPALSVLIPAAGSSERLGEAKQLVSYKGKALIQHAVNTASSIDPHEIFVITGANARAIENTVSDPRINWLHNPQWPAGMGGSIAMGAARISPESTGLMILLCDQWRIRTEDLQALVETWYCDPQRIVVAEADGHYMPPAIFPSSCFIQLQGLEGKHGARSLFTEHTELLIPVPMKNAAFDLDTQTQLDHLKKGVECHDKTRCRM